MRMQRQDWRRVMRGPAKAGHYRVGVAARRALALTAPASRERVAPIVFRPRAGGLSRTRVLGAEDGRERIGDRTRRAASTQVVASTRGPAKAGHYRVGIAARRALALTAPAIRERVAPIVFRPRAGGLPRTRVFGAEDGRERIGDRTRRAASTQVAASTRGPAKAGHSRRVP